MQTATLKRSWWYPRKLALTSLLLSALEMLIVWGVYYSGATRLTHPTAVKATDIAWCVGGPGAFLVALIALAFDSKRGLASLGVISSIGAFIVCGLTKLV